MMKKWIVSWMLVICLFSVSYPVIYATEENNIPTNEATNAQEEEKTQNLVTEELAEEPEEREPEESAETSKPEEIIEQEPKQEEPETEKAEQPVEKEAEIIPNDEPQNVEAPLNYAGRMYLDSPANNQTIMASTNTLKIQGWAVSSDSQSTLRLYVNGNYISNIQTRTSRGDVDNSVSPAYGGTANTPKAGFEYDLNIGSYAQGTYQIVVYQIARNETIISTDTKTIQIKPTQYIGKMCVETGTNVGCSVPQTTKMNLSGWAVSNDTEAYIVANIDGNDCRYQVARQARGDVDGSISPAYGGTAKTPRAGFSMEIDIANLSDGKHTVRVSQVSRFGQILGTVQITLNITTPLYAANMNLESPIHNKRYRSSSLEVSGWVMSEATDDYIHIYINGTYQGTATRIARPDVIGVFNGTYGGATYNPTPGFKAYIDTSKFGEGVYNLKVVHYSKYGKELESREINFIISNTTTWGIDVSHHQGAINWNAVKSSGVNFAILKIGEYRESSGRILKDEHFEEYYSECKRLGIAVGGYFYSYAFNPTEAAHEADACAQLISGKSFEMPIFFDIEDKLVTNEIKSGGTNRNEVTNAAITFCDILNSRGYQAGVYSYRNFFYEYLNMAQLERYNVWLAHYVQNTDYTGKYDMWQYKSDGTIPGINGAVDLNWCFKRYY